MFFNMVFLATLKSLSDYRLSYGHLNTFAPSRLGSRDPHSQHVLPAHCSPQIITLQSGYSLAVFINLLLNCWWLQRSMFPAVFKLIFLLVLETIWTWNLGENIVADPLCYFFFCGVHQPDFEIDVESLLMALCTWISAYVGSPAGIIYSVSYQKNARDQKQWLWTRLQRVPKWPFSLASLRTTTIHVVFLLMTSKGPKAN